MSPSKADLLAKYADGTGSTKKRKAGDKQQKKRKRKSKDKDRETDLVCLDEDNEAWKLNKAEAEITPEELQLFKEQQVASRLRKKRSANGIDEEGEEMSDDDPVIVDLDNNQNLVAMYKEQKNLSLTKAAAIASEMTLETDSKEETVGNEKQEIERMMDKQLQYEWGVGKADRKKRQVDKDAFEALKKETFARYADDKQLNTKLKETVRSGDPMANLLTKKPTLPSRKSKKQAKKVKKARKRARDSTLQHAEDGKERQSSEDSSSDSDSMDGSSRRRPLYSGPPPPRIVFELSHLEVL